MNEDVGHQVEPDPAPISPAALLALVVRDAMAQGLGDETILSLGWWQGDRFNARLGTTLGDVRRGLEAMATAEASPIPMVLHCPRCGAQHIDAPEPEIGWENPPHRSHSCHGCQTVWRPADVLTTGVAAIETRGKADSWP